MKRIGLGLLVVLMLLFMANAFMAWRVQSQHTARIAAIRAAGDPASIAELRPAPIPNDRNAAAQIELLEPFLKGWGHDNMVFSKTDLGKAYEERQDRWASLTDEQADAMRAILVKYPQIAEGVSLAAACTQYASRGDFSVTATVFSDKILGRITQLRDAVRFAVWQGLVSAHDGKADDAVRQGIEILHIGRLAEHEPTLTGLLTAISVQHIAVGELAVALNSGKVSPEVHAALDAELALCDDPQSFARSLKTERAYSLDAIDQMILGQHPALAKLLLWKAKSHFLEGLDFYDKLLPAASTPWWGLGGSIYSVIPGAVPSTQMQMVLPAVQAAYEAANRKTALIRSVRVLNALREFAEKNGREASGLVDLSLPAEAMVDPYSGQPLILKHADAGWTVYSVGKDEKDDGGELGDNSDVGVGPPGVVVVATEQDAGAVEGDAAEK